VPRKARIDLAGYLYHIIVRGVNRCAIFRCDDDRSDFIRRLGFGLLESQSLCLTWALMTNHLHLLVVAGVQGVASLMQPVLTGYAGAFNRKYQRVGHLVQNRFKAIICQEDRYLRELAQYIPLNPVRAGIVKSPAELADYPWTGHAALLGKSECRWQATDQLLSHFGATTESARQAYEDFVVDRWMERRRPDLENGNLKQAFRGFSEPLKASMTDIRKKFTSQILGDESFVKEIFTKIGPTSVLIRPRTIEEQLLTIRQAAAKFKNVAPEALVHRDRRAAVSEARALWIYSAVQKLGLKLSEFIPLTGLSSGSISEIFQRGRQLEQIYAFLDKLG
jgi:putative transposase